MPERGPSLADEIDFQIRTGGPISIATYMGLCLTHPSKGYYRRATPLGAAGDFVTAPEISQMFGELIGAFVADLYVQMGRPARFTLLELGPGRGTLARDLLRTAGRVPGFREAVDVALYETHPDLTAQQRTTLADWAPRHIDTLDDLPDVPVVVVANEFFDALPIRQFVRRDGQWFERSVGLIDGQRRFGLSPTPFPASAMPEVFRDAEDGAVAEIGLAAEDFATRLARKVAPRGGALLAIDYGYARTQPGETLQAVSRHGFADPLEAPGAVDLSAHVNFETLDRAARMAGLKTLPLVTQGHFLASLGIEQRAEALSRANPGTSQTILDARDRLIGSSGMGDLFKVFCAASPGLSPAGFGASGA